MRSNFNQPDDKWYEGQALGEYFRQDGYYHIRVRDSGFGSQNLKVNLADFRLYLEAEFIAGSKETDRYAIYFRNNGKGSFYAFSILRSGCYTLRARVNKALRGIRHPERKVNAQPEWTILIDSRFSDLIRSGNNPNSLMIEMAGQKITLGVNGYILDTVMDNTIAEPGSIGLYVFTDKDYSVKEVRFRDFRLYSLEQ